MTKVYVKLYDPFVLTGNDFPPISSNLLRRVVFSPDSIHSISVGALRDGALLFTNEAACEFQFSISRNHRVLAVIKCRRGPATLRINNNWLVTENGVENRPITENPDLLLSSNVNIDFEAQSIGRVDFKINESGFACGIFTERDLIFLRMNGNHAFPRLVDFIAKEARMLPINEVQALVCYIFFNFISTVQQYS